MLMKKKTKNAGFKRTVSFLLVILMLTGVLPVGLVSTVHAAAANPTLNQEQAAPVAALGFSTDQPVRYSPSGQVVDRTKSPFGVDNITKFGVKQLLVNYNTESRLMKSSGENSSGYKNAYQIGIQGADARMGGTDMANAKERVSVEADTDGDGLDETLTVFWVPTTEQGQGKVGIAISKYTTTWDGVQPLKVETTTKVHFPVSTNTSLFSYSSANNDYERTLYAVSGDFDHDGKDELALGRGKTIAMYRVTITKLKELSMQTLESSSTSWDAAIKEKLFSTNRLIYVNGMTSADLDDDGFKELFVTAGRSYISQVDEDTDVEDYEKGLRSFMLIYRSTTNLKKLSIPPVELVTTAGENTVYFDKPAMDMGDIFGDGGKELVIGGRLFGRKDDNNVGITTFSYDPESDSYQTGLKDNRLYTFVSDDFKAVQSKLGVKCVKFDPAVFLDFVVLGGFIYKYNMENDVFDRQVISNISLTGVDVNKESKSRNNLTNVNTKKDKTYILDMLAGNFNEATLDDMGSDLSEQLVVLHHNSWYNSRRVYITTVSMKDGVLYAYMLQYLNSKDNSHYFSICAPDIWNRGLQMEYQPDETEFVFSDPMILAVLAAPPFYSELENEYEALGNAKTLFGTEKSKSSSESHGLSVSASFLCGFDGEVSVLGMDLAKAGWELEVENEFTAAFEKSKSVSKHVLYENYYNQDAVVVSAIPYDVYIFKITNTQTGESGMTTVMIPFAPVTRIMSYTSYKKVAESSSAIPQLTGVFKHTVGDPRSYPKDKTSISNVTGAEILMGNSGDDYGNFVGVGIGNNVTEEGISVSQGQSRTLENKLSVKFTAFGGAGGFYVGGSAGLGYTYSNTKSTEETEMYSGSTPGLPEGREVYTYKWSLVAYPYDLTAGSATQRCMAISYMCQPVGANYPPAPPKNFRMDSRDATSITLKWDAPVTTNIQTTGLPSGYAVYRADSIDGEYKKIGTISGRSTVTYKDTKVAGTGAYYYRLMATNTRESIPAELFVPRVKATAMTLKTAPKLSYGDGGTLDLSSLKVTLAYENGKTRDVVFADFGDDFLVSAVNGSTLDLSQQGSKLTVTYVPDGITIDAGTLNVSAAAAYDIGLTASFTVGTTQNAAKLEAGKAVSATASLKNNTATSQSVLAILALYSDKGTMVASSTKAVTVASDATSTATFTSAFTVPASASGYTVKLFVWDGTSIADTKQVPKSNVITLP